MKKWIICEPNNLDESKKQKMNTPEYTQNKDQNQDQDQDKPKTIYEVIESSDIFILEKRVNEDLRYGWECQGGIFKTPGNLWCQAMIKPGKPAQSAQSAQPADFNKINEDNRAIVESILNGHIPDIVSNE